MMMEYAIVEFSDGKSIAIIHNSWFVSAEEDTCFWPPQNPSKFAKDKRTPDDSWSTYDIKVLAKAATYMRATEKLKKAEATSDLETTDLDENPNKSKRRIQRPRKYSSDEEIMHSPPKFSTGMSKRGTLSKPSYNSTQIVLETQTENPLETEDLPSQSILGRATLKKMKYQPPRSGSTPNSSLNTVYEGGSVSLSVKTVERIFTYFEETKNELHQIKKEVRALKHHSSEANVAIELDEDFFPLENLDALNEIEQKLVDPVFKKKVLFFLQSIGGIDLKDSLSRMLCSTMKASLSEKFTLFGTKDKKPFVNLKLYPLICKALWSTKDHEKATKKDIERIVSRWLSNSSDRDGGRSKRKKRPIESCGQANTNTDAIADQEDQDETQVTLLLNEL